MVLPIWLSKAFSALSGIPSFVYGRWYEARKKKIETDVATYEYLRKNLPTFEEIKLFFKDKSLTDAFETDTFCKVRDTFATIVEDPEKNFIDEKLQARAADISRLCREMSVAIGQDTFPVPNDTKKQTIRREKYGFKKDDFETGERLNKLATRIFDEFIEFRRLGKAILHIAADT